MMAVVIDPGHGGENTGTVAGELVEKDITLMLAQALALSLHDLPVSYHLTRYGDDELSLLERGQIAEKYGADLVVSIHVNAHAVERFHGLEAYHWPGSYAAKIGADAMADVCPKRLRAARVVVARRPDSADSRWLENPRAVLSAFKAPTILAECGYSTNPNDNEYLLDKWGRAEVVSCLRSGIVAALREIEEARPYDRDTP